MPTHWNEESMLQQPEAAAGAKSDKKTVNMPVGVPDYTLRDEPREVPVTEPPVWPINKDLKYVGKSPERWDGLAKATGRARYTSDVQLPGMLYAKFVNANVPHAKVVSVDTSAAEKHPGVRAVHVIEHVLGNASLRDPSLEQVNYPVVRYAGQPIAAVAAISPSAAEDAAALVKVKYETLPFVVDLDKARDCRRAAGLSRRRRPGWDCRRRRWPAWRSANRQYPWAFHPQGCGYRAGIAGCRCGCRRALRNAGADTLGPGDARRGRRLETGDVDGLGFDPGGFQRARGTCRVLQDPDDADSRPHRVHGRRIRREVRSRQSWRGRRGFIEEDGSAGPPDAGSRGRASLRRQSSQLRSDAAHRREEGRHAHRCSPGQLRHRRLRHGGGMCRSGLESLQVRRTSHRGERRIHQRGAGCGHAGARTSAGSFRAGADDRRTCSETQSRPARPARTN